jgi:hypothetical protein
VNQKKCPKCGENNPAEAVMCWACYTPLSGAPVATGPIPGSTPAPGEAPEKKPIAPWQIGVIGLALLIAAGFGISTFIGGTPADAGMDSPIPNVDGPRNIPSANPGGGNVTIEAPQAPAGGGQPQQNQPAPQAPQYAMTTGPDKRWQVATVGIVPVQAGDAQQAGTLAAVVGRKVRNAGSWRSTQVYVFADRQTANTFQQYQRGRDNRPLGPDDYAQLREVWRNTLVRYESNGGAESVRYPQSNVNGWWSGSATPARR